MIKVSTTDDDTTCFDIKLHIPICMLCERHRDCYYFAATDEEIMFACDDFQIAEDGELRDILSDRLLELYDAKMCPDMIDVVINSQFWTRRRRITDDQTDQ